MYEVCLYVCGCECVHAKARGTLCLTSFRQSLLLNPELGWPLSPNHLPVSIQLRAGCICPRSQVTWFTGDGDCTSTSGFHSRVFDCWATTPAPPTTPLGFCFCFWDSASQCFTACYDGQDGLEFCCFLYSINSWKGNWHSILSALVPWLYVQPHEVTCIMTSGLAEEVRPECYMERKVRNLAPLSLLVPYFHRNTPSAQGCFPSLAAAMLLPQQNQWPHYSRTLNQNKPLCFVKCQPQGFC